MPSQIIWHKLADSINVYLHGPKDDPRQVLAGHSSHRHGGYWIQPAGHKDARGFLEIIKPTFGPPKQGGPDFYADGIMTDDKNIDLVMTNADCPIFVMHETTTEMTLLGHAGRAALSPSDTEENIITLAYDRLTKGMPEPKVIVYITGSICDHCFEHDQDGAEEFIAPFRQWYPAAVTDKERGTLDMPKLIRWQLEELGVNPENITHDGVCTKGTDWLASHRGDPNGQRNAICMSRAHRD